MSETLKDGTGSNFEAKVDSDFRLHTDAITQSQLQNSLKKGRTWNVGTGFVTLTNDSASALMYLKNTGDKDLNVDLYVFLTKASTGGSGQGLVEILRNPTAGTVVDDATAITPTNMNFGSTAVPDALLYSGGQGKTLSGQDDILRSLTTSANRLLLGIVTLIPKGKSVGLRLTPPTGNTSMEVECVMEVFEVGHDD